ncbi:MAG: hypothetical protein Q7T01_01195 [bacterium]|nr:hypothetical protein [bacterium]
MSLGQGETFDSALAEALQEAGLPLSPTLVIGQQFRFGSEHGSHHNILVGTIIGIELGDEAGLELYVSNPRIWGTPLISIMYSDGTWSAYMDVEMPEWTDEELEDMSEEERTRELDRALAARFIKAARFINGEFTLLPPSGAMQV